MKQTKLNPTVREGEYIPSCIDNSNILFHISHTDFRVGIKNVSVSFYRTRDDYYVLNHMVTTDTIRNHFCLSGTIETLCSKIETFLNSISNSMFWEFIYRELFEPSPETLPDFDIEHSYSPSHFSKLFTIFNKEIYSDYFTNIYKETPLVTIFPNSDITLQDKQEVFIGGGQLHKLISQTLALRKLHNNTVDTVFWFGKLLSDNSIESLSDMSDIRASLDANIEVQVKRDGVTEYKKRNVDTFVENVLSSSEDVCFVFNRSSMDESISQQTAEYIQNSAAHAIISDTDTLLNRFTEEWELSIPRKFSHTVSDDTFKLYAPDSINNISDFKLTHGEKKFTFEELRFNNFELVPIKTVENKNKDLVPDFYSTEL